MIKSIELTEKHKEMLLEMCRELYPEYISWQLYDLNIGILDYWKSKAILKSIHWFEFCNTFLIDKLFYPDGNGKRNTRELVSEFLFQTFIYGVDKNSTAIHPIDYLYEEFIKINNNDNKKEKK